ncbi:MAG: right-handed parallel beta-helix repeat-containing protein, partial [Bacteroidales bacterium]|nr:right-handed parallel beta-helix repeat-containing protein [Bacteroidales bacterium]
MKAKYLILLIALIQTSTLLAKEFHVSKNGKDNNPGTFEAPFFSIQKAASVAQPGDIINVHEGVYRERINPPVGGTSDNNRITYQAADGENVIIKGSEIVKNWEYIMHDTWKVTLSNSYFGDFNPYTDIIHGEWYSTPMDGYDRHTGAVYLNERWLSEAADLSKVLQPAEEELFWFGMVDSQNTTLYAQFKEIDPNNELVEINVRQSIFYPEMPGRNYITVRGFKMLQAATPWSGAMSEQIGLIGTHWSRGWIIEDNDISFSMNTGITLGRYELKVPMPPVTAEGFICSIELASGNGWSKEKIGSHIVRNNRISHCEKNGIHGSLGGIFSIIEGNIICDIGAKGWISGTDLAGIKLLGSQDVLIKGNCIVNCGKGIWMDWMAQGTRISSNLCYNNIQQDFYAEVNHGPYIVDNNLFLSRCSVWDMSQGGAYVHNLMAGMLNMSPHSRKTPYHLAHSTEILGYHEILGGDNRFINNIFLSGYIGNSKQVNPEFETRAIYGQEYFGLKTYD